MKKWGLVILLSILILGFISGGIIYTILISEEKLFPPSGDFFGGNNGDVVSQERKISGFDSITLDGIGDVNVHPGEEYKVIVTTNSNLQEKILTSVTGTTLYIDQEKNFNSFNSKNIKIDVYTPELKSITMNGAGLLKINSGNASELDIVLSGIGSIDAQDFQVENMNVMHSGAGEIKLWATQTLKAELSGIGSIKAEKHPLETADIIHSGAGEITIWVTQTLKAELSGIGDILYKGNPKTDLNINGIGTIKPIN